MSLDELLKCIRKSRLLSEKQFARVRQHVQSGDETLTPESLATTLVGDRLLTEWHAKMLLQKQTGFVLGQYKLLMPIGKGGMGKVFKARDRKNKCMVAIKVLSKKLAKNQKLVARFQREIEVASKLDSPYIVRTVDAGVIGESHFMVMEFVDGESIDAIANRQGRMNAGHACELVRQAALGLQAGHEAGMVHRDIKPANLMVTFADGTPFVRLLDMGLARLDEQENDGMTRTGQVMGTPDYMAPEQGWDTASVDIRADIYSLGCTLFRLVTGSVPFQGDNPLQVLMARCSQDAPLASSIVPDLDRKVDGVIRGMTFRDPDKRFQTPAEVARALESISTPPTAEELLQGNNSGAPASQPTVAYENGSPPEPTFREFLRDMDSGAEVKLLDGSSPAETFDTSAGSSIRMPGTQPTRRKSSKLPWFVGLGGVIATLAIVGVLAMNAGESEPAVKKTAPEPIEPAPVVYFADIPAQRTEPGQVVSFYATPEIQDGLEDVRYELGGTIPEGATMDAESGEFYWLPPTDQKSGRITLQLLAKRDNKVEAEAVVFIDVRAAVVKAEILKFENENVTAGQPWSRKVSLFGQNTEDAKVEFRLVGDSPEGLQLDAKTGELTWTPLLSQVGPQPINIEILDPASDRTLDSETCSVLVLPGTPTVSIALPDQTVQAGKTLRLDLSSLTEERTRRLSWSLPTPKPGATVQESGAFEWNVPTDESGMTTFRFQVANRRRSGIATMRVNVLAKSKDRTMTSNTSAPSRADVAQAETEIKQLFKRDFAANSTSARKELATKLLARSYDDQQSETMRYALLKLGLENATKARAYAVGCEIIELLRQSYEIDSVAQLVALIDGFKVRFATSVDKAVLGESLFREGLRAASTNRFQSVASFVKAGSLLAKKGPYADVLDQAAQQLKALPADTDTPDELDDKQSLARRELMSLLDRFQFTQVFTDTTQLRFVQSQDADPAVSRSLWKISDSQIRMESPQVDFESGFVDPSINSSSYVLRLQVSSESTNGNVLIGSPGSGRIFGYIIPIAGKDRLAIKQTNLPQPLAKPTGRLGASKTGWDLVEIVVTPTSIGVSLNGNRVTETSVEEAPQGTAGVVVDLRAAAAEHRLSIRNARFMIVESN